MNKRKMDKIKKYMCLLLAFIMVFGVLAGTLSMLAFAAGNDGGDKDDNNNNAVTSTDDHVLTLRKIVDAKSADGDRSFSELNKRDDSNSIKYRGRYDILFHIENINLTQVALTSIGALLNGGSFKFDEHSKCIKEERSEMGNTTGFDIAFTNVMYTGKGNSTNVKLWYKEKDGNSHKYDFSVTFDEYKFVEYKEGTGGDTSEPDISPLTPRIMVKNYNVGNIELDDIKPGDEISLETIFFNTSDEIELENIIMTIEPGSDFYIENSSNLYRLNHLDMGDDFVSRIKLRVKEGVAAEQSHTVKFSFKYQYITSNGSRVEGNCDETIAIPINVGEGGSDVDKKNPLVPHVIIKEYSYGGQSVTAGETVTLTVSCGNTSNKYDLENIVMKVATPEGMSIASSSNSFYIDKLEKESAFTKSIDIQVRATALPESHNIDISFEYQYVANGERKEGTSKETIAIPVSQIDRFAINNIDVPSVLYQGDEYPMSISLINKGKSAVGNVTVEFVTEDGSQGESQYIGNVESGKEATGDFFVSGKEAGELKGKFIVTYEDSNLNIKTLEREFTIVVEGMDYYEPDIGIDEPFEPIITPPTEPAGASAKDITKNLMLVICGLVVAGLTAYTTILKIKAQRSDMSDEDF